MNLDAKEICRILKFWTDIEILSPFAISTELHGTRRLPSDVDDEEEGVTKFRWDEVHETDQAFFDKTIEQLPTERVVESPVMNLFTVHLGVVNIEVYIRAIADVLRKEKRELSEEEFDMRFSEIVPQGQVCLATFKINHFGKVLPGTFTPSYALCWLIQKKLDEVKGVDTMDILSTYTDLMAEFEALCEQHLRYVPPVYTIEDEDEQIRYDLRFSKAKAGKRTFGDLRQPEELKAGHDFIDMACGFVTRLSGINCVNEVFVLGRRMKDPKRPVDDMLNSRFVDILTTAQRTLETGNPKILLSKTLQHFFVEAMGNHEKKDILANPRNLYELINPSSFNLGRWPASLSHELSCLQQVAVSQLKQLPYPSPIFSLNGPPGTGKTTLLRELIADIVVQRANKLVGIESIKEEELFDTLNAGDGDLVKVIRKKYGEDCSVVVASHTNKAVENISKEFPLQYGYEPVRFDYFGRLAQELLHSSRAWGCLSVALGRTENWNSVYKTLFITGKNEKKPLIRRVFEEEIKNIGGTEGVWKKWKEEKLDFVRLQEEVKTRLRKASFRFEEDYPGSSGAELAPFLKKLTGSGSPAKPFYFDFSNPENITRHLEPLYTDKELDRLRTELFLSALNLHKYTILSQHEGFIAALKKSFALLAKADPEINPIRLLDTFSFLCPVVSTTLAASPTRFGKFTKESIPWVVVDEASQVSAAHAYLLMEKARRLFVLGDPKQLSPVVTLPNIIIEMLAESDPDLLRWSPHFSSFQVLCDGTQKYGTWIGRRSEGMWTGFPLRAHRRCYPPMFSISNAISYANQMVLPPDMQRKESRENFLKSFWLNVVPAVQSQSNDVAEEGEALTEVLRYVYRELNALYKKSADIKRKSVMICTPFRATERLIGNIIREKEINSNRNQLFRVSRYGTVHKMQGQQADIMILVLGSRTGENGAGARKWATNPPNLFNVAVSRAIETLIIVGNYDDWIETDVMSEVAYQIQRYGSGKVDSLAEL